MERYITTPITNEVIKDLKIGDYVYITGIIYSARDAAHNRLYDSILKGEKLPLDLKDTILYYLGPTPAREGAVIGSAGPTTSSRMDKYTPKLLEYGLKGMIGKGRRSQEVKDSIIKHKGIYFAAVGGAGALLSKRILKSTVVAYEDLGTEAIRELYVENFPAIVVVDSEGRDLYDIAADKYKL